MTNNKTIWIIGAIVVGLLLFNQTGAGIFAVSSSISTQGFKINTLRNPNDPVYSPYIHFDWGQTKVAEMIYSTSKDINKPKILCEIKSDFIQFDKRPLPNQNNNLNWIEPPSISRLPTRLLNTERTGYRVLSYPSTLKVLDGVKSYRMVLTASNTNNKPDEGADIGFMVCTPMTSNYRSLGYSKYIYFVNERGY